MFLRFGIIVCLTIFGSNGQESCLTPTGAEGACIILTECSPLLNLLKHLGNLQPAEKETLTKSQCGFEGNTPKVCCPENTQGAAAMTVDSAAGVESTGVPTPPDVTKHPNLRLINNPICGPVTETRIIQGRQTKVLEFPWMVLIAHNITGRNSALFACGGSLITKRYVLTAAHCVTELGSRTILSGVRVGEHDLTTEPDCSEDIGEPTFCVYKHQDFLIESIHPHSDYQKISHQNDIALIRMNGDADFEAPNVRPICLPIGDAVTLRAKKVIVSGWGTTEIGIRSQKLLKVSLEIASSDDCAKVYRENHTVNITYKQLCAGGKDSRDTCTGDSGGPLIYPAIIGGTPKYVQYGIINFGPARCGSPGFPGVYLKVAYYMDWILDTIIE